MKVLRPNEGSDYLIVSQRNSEEAFQNQTTFKAFINGHKRAFENLRTAKEKGVELPMKSSFKTYEVISR